MRVDMPRQEKLLEQILRGTSDANINFTELCALLIKLGFDERIRGSHHIFTRENVVEIINLQSKGAKAKAYQVKQVRNVILKCRLGGDDDSL
jgi:HicA toxin of bacterial toxin-antitoxin,